MSCLVHSLTGTRIGMYVDRPEHRNYALVAPSRQRFHGRTPSAGTMLLHGRKSRGAGDQETIQGVGLQSSLSHSCWNRMPQFPERRPYAGEVESVALGHDSVPLLGNGRK
jgi:hypothetical protein